MAGFEVTPEAQPGPCYLLRSGRHQPCVKDDDRRRTYPNEKFDFLGYTFRPRRSKNRRGKYFIKFSPAVSDKAVKTIRAEIRSWNLHLRSDKSIEDLSRTLKVTLILDLIHALEKLWKAAYVFHAEGSLEADLWVLDRTLRILLGDVGQVVKGIRQSITKRALAGAKRKTLEGVADYLYRNRARMRYDEYLARGWPIASGPVEGACKNLIKDRMERSGMRWTERMAEAIVQLRAIYLSGDFDRYWQFHIEQDQRRLYPAGGSVVPK